MKKVIIIIVAYLLLIGCDNNKEIIPRVIPISTYYKVPVITVNINGKPAILLVDSGAQMSMIDANSSHYYGFRLYDSDDGVTGVNGTTSKILHVSGAKTYYGEDPMYIRYRAADLSALRNAIGAVGIVGSDFMGQNKAFIDFENKVFIIK